MRVYAVCLVSTLPPYESQGSILSWSQKFPKKFILHKKTLAETCWFLSKTLSLFCQPGTKTSTIQEEMQICVHHREDHLSCVVFTNVDYPKRVAFALAFQAMEQFSTVFRDRWREQARKDALYEFPQLQRLLNDYQNPSNHDSIARAIENSDAAIEVITGTLNRILIRGETIGEIAMKSEELSAKSKIFYNESKKAKRCCIIF
ncbi:unnamed protein product [Blepharisma stoltei]|uniref:Uncharacterized protein n=1 Tax=Blepharisma stoltei TaxID=1481888 RepID=A0AAU9J2V9_9CILI|nr:unnamed protein product [Blepharisma stoltei]